MAMFIRIIIQFSALIQSPDRPEYRTVPQAESKKREGIVSYLKYQAFPDSSGRQVNVTSSTPFLRVFCIERMSTGGSAADVL
jgi:hypothetical protein